MLNFDNWEFWLYVGFVLLLGLIEFFRTGSLKRSVKKISEVIDLNYRTIDSKRQEDVVSQEFSEFKSSYVLNEDSNELEELEVPINIQAQIQSYLSSALENALERFLPGVLDEVGEQVAHYQDTVVDLADLGQAMETAEFYREQLGLSDKASMSDIYSAVDKLSQEYKSAIGKVTVKQKGGEQNGSVQETSASSSDEQA